MFMLIHFYLATTAASWAILLPIAAVGKNKLKRKGYEFVKEDFLEKFPTWMCSIARGFIPFYNILCVFFILFMDEDKFYDDLEIELLEKGKIYKPDDEKLNNNSESHFLDNGKEDTYTESIQKIETKKIRTEKTYDKMTIEEKLAYLQQEKERLLNQGTLQDENPFTLNKR